MSDCLPDYICQALKLNIALELPAIELLNLTANLEAHINLPSLDELIGDISFPGCCES